MLRYRGRTWLHDAFEVVCNGCFKTTPKLHLVAPGRTEHRALVEYNRICLRIHLLEYEFKSVDVTKHLCKSCLLRRG